MVAKCAGESRGTRANEAEVVARVGAESAVGARWRDDIRAEYRNVAVFAREIPYAVAKVVREIGSVFASSGILTCWDRVSA